MAYEINKSDGMTLVTLLDGEIDSTATDLVLLGKNYLGYGEVIAENFVHSLENFAGKTRDQLVPLEGQIWYNKTDSTIGYKPQEVYFNVDGNNTLSSWKQFASFTPGTGIAEVNIKDVTNQLHKCIKITIRPTGVTEGVLIAILSVDADFVPHADENLVSFCGGVPSAIPLAEGDYNDTGTIGKGLNLNSGSDFKLRGVAVEAEFADVAEIYVGDANYEPGTLVSLGGAAEVTQTNEYADTNIFGIVSSRPAYLMNARRKSEKNALPIAVAGRIPVRVKGAVKRGDRLVASDVPGVAQAADGTEPAWSVVGRSLGNFDGTGIGKIEATIGVR